VNLAPPELGIQKEKRVSIAIRAYGAYVILLCILPSTPFKAFVDLKIVLDGPILFILALDFVIELSIELLQSSKLVTQPSSLPAGLDIDNIIIRIITQHFSSPSLPILAIKRNHFDVDEAK
jgi:hypothetical protein